MKIISMSMDDGLFAELERVQRDLAFNRSEVLRRGVALMRDETKAMEQLHGHVDCVLFVVHGKAEGAITKAIHQSEAVRTHLHSSLCNNKCLELFVLHGEAERIKDLYRALKRNKKVEYIKLVVP